MSEPMSPRRLAPAGASPVPAFMEWSRLADVERFEALLDRELPDRRGRKLVLEWRAACRHVGFLVRQGALGLPVTVSKRESPDFELRSGLQTILLEATEATPPRYRAVEASAGGDQPDGSVMIELDPELLRPSSGKPRRGDERFIVRPGGKLSGDGSVGSMPERHWIELVVNALKQKKKKNYSLPAEAVLHLFIVGEPIFPGVKDNIFHKHHLKREVCSALKGVGIEPFKLAVIDLGHENYVEIIACGGAINMRFIDHDEQEQSNREIRPD